MFYYDLFGFVKNTSLIYQKLQKKGGVHKEENVTPCKPIWIFQRMQLWQKLKEWIKEGKVQRQEKWLKAQKRWNKNLAETVRFKGD